MMGTSSTALPSQRSNLRVVHLLPISQSQANYWGPKWLRSTRHQLVRACGAAICRGTGHQPLRSVGSSGPLWVIDPRLRALIPFLCSQLPPDYSTISIPSAFLVKWNRSKPLEQCCKRLGKLDAHILLFPLWEKSGAKSTKGASVLISLSAEPSQLGGGVTKVKLKVFLPQCSCSWMLCSIGMLEILN